MENLGIDGKLLIAQLINFGLFFYVFKRFIAKPFMQFISQEKQNAEEREKIFAKAKTMEEKLIEKEKQMKSSMKKESDAMLADAKKTAEKVRKELIHEANVDAEAIRADAKKQLETERAELEKQAKEKINEMSFFIVKSALKDVIQNDVQKKVTDALIKNSPKEVRLN